MIMLYRTLRNADGDGTEGGGGMEDNGVQTEVVAAPVQEVKPTFSQDDLIAAVRTGTQTALEAREKSEAAKNKPAEKPLSPEEYDRIFRRAIVTKEDVQRLFNSESEEDRVKALQALLDRSAAHADTLAQYRTFTKGQELETRFNKFYNEQFSPIQIDRLAQWEQKMESGFFEKYPDLKQFLPLCKEVVTSLKAEKVQFKSPEHAFDTLAGRVQNILKSVPGYQPGTITPNGNGAGSNGTTNPRKMTPVSTGGQVGTGGSNGAKSTAASIFG